jgi:NAD(P)-dependent dehydrogenase (short-subunit alcohol dehydrogenase family)
MGSTEVNNLFSVKGRVALITGGTSGIGLMIAKVRAGYKHLVTDASHG